ncbi:NHL repeat-containing protein [Neorhodopirellula pilleata]|uniref:SMP-30/Gluconolaconase/LRE-like region n=1 Tax=Neorhodopirellula pilleata TaxID=2714738 RepID=A0A5C6APV9_9BACT|nr:hypothetical protein [Neorhodopirellula pilleata]TWU02073.1 SMP-30/Gluconolaconase/LRE-like region [Neorhodopirellula pilleata]
MRKNCLTGTNYLTGIFATSFTILICLASSSFAADETQTPAESSAKSSAEKPTETSVETPADYWTQATEPVYPRGAAISAGQLLVVDSDAPAVWSVAWPADASAQPKRLVTGSRYLRKTINRPFCATGHPENGVLVGDAATREIYHVTEDADGEAGQNAKPLNRGYLGIPMALAVSPDATTLYVGDAERRAVFSLPIEGVGEDETPELIVRVNARGLVFDADGALWAVTPDAEAVHKIDVKAKTSEPIVTGRPYGFPGGIAWDSESKTGFVSDVYGKCVWQFTADGKTEKWFEGEPLVGPVGLTVTPEAVVVADPKTTQVYRIDRETKKATGLFTK